jgi:hypothetical protein
MADTIADVALTNTAYVDLYAATGISVGIALVLQNKGNSDIIVVISAGQPTATDTDGVAVRPFGFVAVDPNESGAWAISATESKVSVQED